MQSSIALTTFNGEKYLSAQLDSILAQTVLPNEMVICDDGSQDNTLEILQNFKARAPFPVHLHFNPENLGYAQNFAQAISLASKEIIFLCDQDDLWEKNKIEIYLNRFAKDASLTALFSNSNLVDANGNSLGKTLSETNLFLPSHQANFHHNEGWKVSLKRNVVAGHALAFRSEAKRFLLPLPPLQNHDAWFAQLFAFGAKIDYLPEALTSYRMHSAQEIGAASGTSTQAIARKWNRTQKRTHKDLEYEAMRCEDLLSRLRECKLPITREAASALQKKLVFLKARAKQNLFIQKLLFALQNQTDYKNYENGWSTIFKDLLTR